MSDFTVRRATTTDLPELLEIEAEAFPALGYNLTTFRQLLELAGPYFRVAVADRVIGYLVGAWSHEPRVAWLLSAAVRASDRKRGVARALTGAVIDEFRSAGAVEFWGTVANRESVARRLWRQVGFEDVRVEADYFGPNEDRVILRLRVPQS